MLAALLLPLLFIEIGLLGLFGYNLFHSGWSPGAAIVLPLGVALGWRALLVLTQFLLAGLPGTAGWRASLRALGGEFLWQLRLYTFGHTLLGRPFAAAPMPDRTPVIVLIHGFFCNAGVWRGFARRLRKRGFRRIHAVNLDPLYRDHARSLALLDQQLQRILLAEGCESVVLIGHSMGGLLARMYRARHPERVPLAIAIGAPHRGTAGAAWGGGGGERGPPSPRTRWLQQFNSEFPLDTGLFNICTMTDNIVWPQRNAQLDTADELKLTGYGHLHLLGAPAVIENVVQRLKLQSTASAG